jgi:hypothetical protein
VTVKLTDSEQLFEKFLSQHAVPFNRIPVSADRTPDYLLQLNSIQIVVEVTSLKGGLVTSEKGVRTKTAGDAIRREVTHKRNQLKWASERKLASLLLMFDSQNPGYPWLLEDMDFETAMYGERTLTIERESMRSGQIFNGRNRKLRQDTNTHISSLGRINYSSQKQIEVTVFPNLYADIEVGSLNWPSCFKVRKFEIEYVDTEPPTD